MCISAMRYPHNSTRFCSRLRTMWNSTTPPRSVLHKYMFDRPDRASEYSVPSQNWKSENRHYNLNAPHRPRQQQPGGQIELRTPPQGWGRDAVVLKDTYQCQHWPCTSFVKLPRGVRIGDDGGGWCPHCNGLICAACRRLGKCIPMEEGLYRYEQLAKIKERMSVEDLRRDVDAHAKFKEIGLISGPSRA